MITGKFQEFQLSLLWYSAPDDDVQVGHRVSRAPRVVTDNRVDDGNRVYPGLNLPD
jgi:hypothetical protein